MAVVEFFYGIINGEYHRELTPFNTFLLELRKAAFASAVLALQNEQVILVSSLSFHLRVHFQSL